MAASSPSERTGIVARRTTDTTRFAGNPRAGEGFGAVAEFLDQKTGLAMKEQVAKDTLADEATLLRLEDAARKHPVAIREAIRTGDYSRFIGIEAASRGPVVTQAASRLGTVLGAESLPQFTKAFTSLPPEEDHRVWSAEYLSNMTNGLPEAAHQAFNTEVRKSIPKLESQRLKVQADYQSQEGLRGAKAVLQYQLDTGELPTMEAVNELAVKHSAIHGVPFLKQREMTRTAFAKIIVQNMGSENRDIAARAMELTAQRDPETGLTIFEEYGENIDGWINTKMKASEAITDQKLKEFHANVDLRMNNIAMGEGGDDSHEQVLFDLVTTYKKHSTFQSPSFLKYHTQISKALAGKAELKAKVKMYHGGGIVPKKDQYAVYKSLDEQQKDIFALKFGIPKEVQFENESTLINGSPEEAIAVASKINTVFHNRGNNNPFDKYVDDPQASMIVMSLYKVQGLPAQKERLQALREGLKKFGDRDPDTAFASIFNKGHSETSGTTSGNSRAATVGASGQRQFILSKLKDMSPQTRKALGMGNWDGDVSNLDQRIYDNIVDRLNQAAVVTYGTGAQSPDQIWNTAQAFMRGDYETLPAEDGGELLTITTTPDYGTDSQGNLVPVAKWDGEKAADWTKRIQESQLSSDLTDILSTKTDGTTSVDGTLIVMRRSDLGTTGPFVIPASRPGEYQAVDEDDKYLLAPILSEWEGGTDEDGMTRVNFKTPREIADKLGELAPVESVDLVDGMRAQWNKKDKQWEVRAYQVKPKNEPGTVEYILKNSMVVKTIKDVFNLLPDSWKTEDDAKKQVQERIKTADLPANMKEAILLMIENGDPKTWTLERLEATYNTNPRTGKPYDKPPTSGPDWLVWERRRRANGGSRIVYPSDPSEEMPEVPTAAPNADAMGETPAAPAAPAAGQPEMGEAPTSAPDADAMEEYAQVETYGMGTETEAQAMIGRELYQRLTGQSRKLEVPLEPSQTEPNHPDDVQNLGVDTTPDHHPALVQSRKEATTEILHTLTERGITSSESTKEAIRMGNPDLGETVQAAVDSSIRAGHSMDDAGSPGTKKQAQSIAESITLMWGAQPYRHNSDYTVGYNFSLYHPEAKGMLEAVGADFSKVMNGKQRLNKMQMERLNDMAVAKGMTFINKHFEGTALNDQQKTALAALSVMSDWDIKPGGYLGPSIVNARLTTAIRGNAWDTASRIIKDEIGPRDWLEAYSREAEGFRKDVYDDSKKIKTIGIGWNIKANPITDADRKKFFDNGYGTDQKRNPDITLEGAVRKHREMLDEARVHTSRLFGENFVRDQPARAMIISDMIFNMGIGSFQGQPKTATQEAKKGFRLTIRYLKSAIASEALAHQEKDPYVGAKKLQAAEAMYQRAAREFMDSDWAKKDVPERAKANYNIFAKGGTPPPHPTQVRYAHLASLIKPNQ